MGGCTNCQNEGYCIPDDCELLKKRPPSATQKTAGYKNNYHAYCSMVRRKKQ